MNYRELTPEDEERLERWRETLEGEEDTISTSFVYDYMEAHGYGFVTTEDGKLRWAIWRDMQPIQIE